MPRSSQKVNEADFKVGIYQEYFGTKKYIFRQEIDRIDFIITDKADNHLLWAETKKNTADIVEMFVQLVLTVGKGRTFDKYNPPSFLAVFDYKKIAFLQYNAVHDLFYQNDFNWNVAPSDKKSKEFNLIRNIVERTINDKKMLFSLDTDKDILKKFFRNNFSSKLDLMPELITYLQIDKNNFVPTYYRWAEKVKPTIAINWDVAKSKGIIDGDFYLADLLSDKDRTIRESLYVLLFMTYYALDRQIDDMGLFQSKSVTFRDEGKAYKEFWEIYQRPPKEELWDYIVERRDLLVPQDIRERKGSFFTPQPCVQRSQEYLSKAFGENWQDEYFIWDCAAGTGNLLVGLTNKYNIWASTLDQADVDVMKDRIKNGANLLEDHVFKFDFLNDDFTKLPENLQGVINDEEKRKKLIIYINPPYAEATSVSTVSGTGKNKAGVSTTNKIKEKYQQNLGKATNEIFSLFIARVYYEIPCCILGMFSKVKFINSQNFKKFRQFFHAKFRNGFIAKADIFDNVKGQFPIGFSIWELSGKSFPKTIKFEIMGQRGSKKFYSTTGHSINKWLKEYDLDKNNSIGYVCNPAPDFLKTNQPYITTKEGDRHFNYFGYNANNIFEGCIYFSVRLCIEPTWLNDRDQFLYPNDNYKTDTEFQNDCLAFTLFHGQNRVSSQDGINQWIPFTEAEVSARKKYKSCFMTDFINGKIRSEDTTHDLFSEKVKKPKSIKSLKFSKQAQKVFSSARELWEYYHKQPNSNADASYYDIREHFQGRNENGKMNNKSDNETYNELIGNLRVELKKLAEKIQPKVYEYGFLLG